MGSGNAKREFIYVDDLSQALILIMKSVNFRTNKYWKW